MDQLTSFEALLFPSDGRYPHMVALMTSPMSMPDPHAPHSTQPPRMPHPEVYMDYIAEGLGPRAWHYHVSRTEWIARLDVTDGYPKARRGARRHE